MALAALLATTAHAALADPLKGEYRAPTDAEIAANPSLKDHMILDVTPTSGYGLDNVDALKSNLGAANTRAEKAESAAAKFKDLPADAAARLEKLANLEKIDPTKEADKLAEAKFEAMKGQLIQNHEAEKTDLNKKAEFLTGHLDQAMRVQAATSAIAEAGGNPDVLLPHVLGQTKFEIVDDKPTVKVIDSAGNARVGDSAGGPMTLSQLVDEFKAKPGFDSLFDASGKSGGGSSNSGGGSNAPTGKKKSELSLNERADYIEKHGMDGYMALPA